MTKLYFNKIDRWRFFAAFAVICAHYVTVFSDRDPSLNKYLRIILTLDGSGAEAGVNFFFVLSGFLITYLLLQEKQQSGKVSIGNFYMRRVLRIWPLYYVSIIIGFLLVPSVIGPSYAEAADWRWYAAFLVNFDQIYNWKDSFPNPVLGVHWSVAVEEQFYLFWPWLVFLTSKRFPWIAFFIIVLAFIFEIIFHLPSHTISSFHDLAIGGVVSWYCFNNRTRVEHFFTATDVRIVKMIYVLGALMVVARYQLSIHISFYEYLDRTANACFFSFIIVEQSFSKRDIFYWLPSFLTYLGKISYGLYLLHPIALFLVFWFLPVSMQFFWFQFPIVLISTLVFSVLSYHLFEVHFMRLKQKF